MLSTLIKQIAFSWEDYRIGKTTDKNNVIHKLVVNEVPEILKSWTPNNGNYKFSGSDGQGNILRTPWFATLNLNVTDSATKGYYLVYLISDDLKNLYLAIGFGAHQFEERYGRGKKVFEAFDVAVLNMRVNSMHLVEKILEKTKSRSNLNKISLTSDKDFHLRAYESCSIYSIKYEISDLPTDDELRNDYLEYLNLYENMIDSLLLADVDSYVYESVDELEIKSAITVEDFVPGKFRKRNLKSGENNRGGSYRHSKTSDKVGKLGEELVYEFEKNRLSDLGRFDLVDRIIWHRNHPPDRTPGWDITSYDIEGNKILIEVKSSEGKSISDIELTVNEWVQAEKYSENNTYRIYLVSSVFNSPVFRVIMNPAKLVNEGMLTISIARYTLLLGSREDS